MTSNVMPIPQMGDVHIPEQPLPVKVMQLNNHKLAGDNVILDQNPLKVPGDASFGLGAMLKVPTDATSLFAGEAFVAYISLINDTNHGVKDFKLRYEIFSDTGKIVHQTVSITTLNSGGRFLHVINQIIPNAGKYTLLVATSCKDMNGMPHRDGNQKFNFEIFPLWKVKASAHLLTPTSFLVLFTLDLSHEAKDRVRGAYLTPGSFKLVDQTSSFKIISEDCFPEDSSSVDVFSVPVLFATSHRSINRSVVFNLGKSIVSLKHLANPIRISFDWTSRMGRRGSFTDVVAVRAHLSGDLAIPGSLTDSQRPNTTIVPPPLAALDGVRKDSSGVSAWPLLQINCAPRIVCGQPFNVEITLLNAPMNFGIEVTDSSNNGSADHCALIWLGYHRKLFAPSNNGGALSCSMSAVFVKPGIATLTGQFQPNE